MMGKDKYHPKLWKGPWVARGESRDGGRGRGGSDCWKEQVERNPGYTHRTPSKLLLGLGCTEPADLWMRKHVHMKYSLCSCSKGLNMGYASESSGELKKNTILCPPHSPPTWLRPDESESKFVCILTPPSTPSCHRGDANVQPGLRTAGPGVDSEGCFTAKLPVCSKTCGRTPWSCSQL